MSRYQIATILLSILLVGGGTYAGFKITGLSQEISTLESQYAELQSAYNSINSEYQSLESQYHSLEREYYSLEKASEELLSSLQALSFDYENLESRYQSLETDASNLENAYNELEAQNQELRSLLALYESLPDDYYSVDAFMRHSNTYEELREFLSYEFALPRGYETGVFDCSESSAYLEWALEIADFDADIVVGPTPWSQNSGRHAWVIAHTDDGYRVAIESTALSGSHWLSLFLGRTPGVVYKNDSQISGWQNYYEGYDHTFGNIYLAARYDLKQFNWWEGYWGFK